MTHHIYYEKTLALWIDFSVIKNVVISDKLPNLLRLMAVLAARDRPGESWDHSCREWSRGQGQGHRFYGHNSLAQWKGQDGQSRAFVAQGRALPAQYKGDPADGQWETGCHKQDKPAKQTVQ